MNKPKLIVVGIDGGGFELIGPWLDQNLLPNIKHMVLNGVSADLLSCLPPVTCPNWRCYATGKNPGKLGMFWWENIDVRGHTASIGTNTNGRQLNFWDVLDDKGYRTAVINTPLTYPPKATNGYMVAGGPDARESGFCQPDSLEKELKSRFGYRVHPSISYHPKHRERWTQEVHALIDSRFRVAEYLLGRGEIDFIQVTSFYINALQHILWDSEAVFEGWQIIDKALGRLLEQGTNVWIMSDHGAMPVEVEFSINSWLEEHGFLVLRHTVSDYMLALGLTRERLKALVDCIGLKRFLKKRSSGFWNNFVPDKQGGLRGRGKLQKVDWERSVALGTGQGPLYIIADKGSTKYKTTLEQLMAQLKELRVPDSGVKIAKDVIRADSIYHGHLMEFSPDLLIEYNHGIHISGSVGKGSVFSKPALWQADNKRDGLFVGFGPDIKGGLKLNNLSIMDLAPSILHFFGVPVSEDIDGEVRRDLFAENSEASGRDVVIVPEYELAQKQEEPDVEKAEVARRLKGLGYLE